MERKSVSRGSRGSRGRAWLAGLAAAAVFFALTLLYLRPVWAVWQDHIAPVPEDPVFNLYVLKWGVHQIRLGLPDLWNANIFYPTRGALALSDHLIGPAFQLALFESIVPNAVAGYNVLFVTSFVASALATAWVVRRGGRSLIAALLAGWIFAFSPFRLQHFNHIQLLIAQWIPLTLWWWDRLLAERTPGHAVRFLLFYLLHVTGGCYLAYMIHVPMIVLFLNRFAVHGRPLLDRRALRTLAPALVVGLAVTAALFLPYLEVSRRLGLSRNENEIGIMGATLASYVSPSTENLYFGAPRRGLLRTREGALAAPFFRTENALFAGFLPTVLAILGVMMWLRGPHPRPFSHRPPFRPGEGRHHPEEEMETSDGFPPLPGAGGAMGEGGQGGEVIRRLVLAILLLTAAAAWLWGDLITLIPLDQSWTAPALLFAVSLGLWLALRRRWRGPWRLPAADPWERGLALSGLVCCALTFPILYVPLSRIVPGLDGMRVPARFYAFVSLAIAWFAARGADLLMDRCRSARARAACGAALAVVLAVELAPRPVHWVPLLREEQFPPVYQWLARQRDVRAVVELPVRKNWRENVAMYYSTLGWWPVANGYSGYEPWSHREIAWRIHGVPDHGAVELLRRLGITHVLIHEREVRRQDPHFRVLLDAFDAAMASGPGRELEPVWRDETVRVYRILGVPPAPGLG